MDKKEPTQISSLSEFIKWVNQLGPGKYLFRGVPNAEYKIQASAYRRLIEVRNFERFLQVNKDLIIDARLRGHGEKDGRELGDLEILAQLQHFGAATCLIDFTRNAQVALYFACQENSKWEKGAQDSDQTGLKQEEKSQDSKTPPDGKVYAVRNDPLHFKKVTPDVIKKRIDYFLPYYKRDHQLYQWEPGYQNNRIIAQQSIFVFGAYEFDENDACIIKESCKKNILMELERVSGITQAMLFPDFDGFARLHDEETPYTEPSAFEYLMRANEAFLSKQYEEAIRNYDKAAELYPNDLGAYEWRDTTNNEEVIDSYDKLNELAPHFFHIYFTYETRGKVHLKLKQYKRAIADFNTLVKLFPDIPLSYIQRGDAKCELKQYQDAIADFDKALQISPNNISTYEARGYAKIDVGKLEEAKEDFQKALALADHIDEWRRGDLMINLMFIEELIGEKE